MPNEQELKAEIGHVLFVDIVGYSKRLINEQGALLQTLKHLVRETGPVRAAKDEGSLIRLPTGDGMALVFRVNVEQAVECALELSAPSGNTLRCPCGWAFTADRSIQSWMSMNAPMRPAPASMSRSG